MRLSEHSRKPTGPGTRHQAYRRASVWRRSVAPSGLIGGRLAEARIIWGEQVGIIEPGKRVFLREWIADDTSPPVKVAPVEAAEAKEVIKSAQRRLDTINLAIEQLRPRLTTNPDADALCLEED